MMRFYLFLLLSVVSVAAAANVIVGTFRRTSYAESTLSLVLSILLWGVAVLVRPRV